MQTEEKEAKRNVAGSQDMEGKTVVFTGSSRGMGRLAAVELGRRGGHIVVVGHNEDRGAQAVQAIRAAGGSAEFQRADMGEAEDVVALAGAVLERHNRIDLLIHSAGGLQKSDARTREGIDRGFAQNFLGAFLLTKLLEERLLASAPARLIAVTSATHRMVKALDLDVVFRPGKPGDSSYQRGQYQMHSYQVAKLALTAWVLSLARRWEDRGVTANALDPWLVKGEFGAESESPAVVRLMFKMVGTFAAKGIEPASHQYIRLATDPALANVSGAYFVSGKEKPDAISKLAMDELVQKRIVEAAETWAEPYLLASPAPALANGRGD